MAKLKIENPWGTDEVYMEITKYLHNGNTAITLCIETEEGFEPYNIVTKNFENLPEDYAYIDTNNNPGVLELLLSKSMVYLTGDMKQSGFCVYPLVRLNFEEIKKYLKPVIAVSEEA